MKTRSVVGVIAGSVGVIAGSIGIALLVLAGCTETKEDVKPDPSAQGLVQDPSGSTGEGVTGEWACPKGTKGARMVLIPAAEGSPYCIDEREAVFGEYKEFIAEKGNDFGAQPSECEWNKDYGPVSVIDRSDIGGDMPPIHCGPTLAEANPDRAVGCLDFCDAYAYCSWAGKRLCGLRGAASGKVNVIDSQYTYESGSRAGDLAGSVESEWFNVCSQGGATVFPYGNEAEPGRCVDHVKTAAEGEDARCVRDTANSQCRGTEAPYDQVYNMSGGEGQWVNICVSEVCMFQGGGIDEVYSCKGALGAADIRRPDAGVRCCADAVR